MISLGLLQRFPFFSFMNEKQLKALTMIAEELKLEPGDVLVEANAPANALYFVTKGNLPYYMVVTSEHIPDYRQEYFVGYINPEEIFGISALLEPYCYTATMRADKPCTVIKINAPALRALCEVDPQLSVGLMKAVAIAAMERLEMTRVLLVAQMAETAEVEADCRGKRVAGAVRK
ncbi:MAG TPA: cyclic nucleotide-binding domain-containing protein [Anaerolineales bacterium]|nr:cyclic nucleotide-binding domain-containing protein [Anaerolineales bacterium]